MIHDKLLYAAIGAAVATAVSLGATCARDDEPARPARSVTQLPDPSAPGDAAPLSEELMISLAQAKNLHHTADVYLQEGDPARAIAAVLQVLSIDFPEHAPEAEDVRLDARARAAKLLLTRGERDEALRVADEGIAAAVRSSFFLANLHTVRGEVLEAQANALADPGRTDVRVTDADQDKARELRREAIRAFEESNRINVALQKALMERAGKATP